MASIQVQNLHFTYPGNFLPVFEDLHFLIDTDWRLGLVGRNGRGKTTLIRLLAGELQGRGRIDAPMAFDRFPFDIKQEHSALGALRNAIAPFDHWEQEMARLLKQGDQDALAQWGELEHRFSAADGYTIDALIARETDKLGIDPEQLGRPFDTFSPGERTRLMLAALFLRKNRFLLIDEPTNHLDMAGRQTVSQYLAGKSGFLLVSHDRAFLDTAVDHIMVLQKNSVVIQRGNYSSYRENKRLQDEFEQEKNRRLKKDIQRLTQSSREKADWSHRIEATKVGQGPVDRGYIGHQAARMMKRSLAIRARIDRRIQEKEGLLKELEYTAPISLNPLSHGSRTLMALHQVTFGYQPDEPLITGLSFTLEQGQRVAVTGGNGAGKSTLLKLLMGALQPQTGRITGPRDLVISTLPQELQGIAGTPWQMARRQGLQTDRFFTLLRKFDFPREDFDRDARHFSMGQRKKMLLAASMAKPAHLYLWDEPLNYIDLESREQIEEMLMETQATLVFVEHDRRFVERVATRRLALDP